MRLLIKTVHIYPCSKCPLELEIQERDDSGYVISLTANGSLLEGESFARGMGLSSSDFTIQEIGGEIRFLCKGRGHGPWIFSIWRERHGRGGKFLGRDTFFLFSRHGAV